MSESIFPNSFNNLNINHKDESEILILSIKDIHNRLKILLIKIQELMIKLL